MVRCAPSLLVVGLVALLAACPPPWETLPYPPGEGEGEGEGDTCVGGPAQTGLNWFETGAGDIMAMVEDGPQTAIATNSDGQVWRIDVLAGRGTSLGTCTLAHGPGQLMRSSSDMLIRTGTGSLCTVTAAGVINEVALGPPAPAEVYVGGAILSDADPMVVLVAYAPDPAGTVLAFDRIEVAADGTIGAPVVVRTVTVITPEARLWRVGNGDRVAVSALAGEIYEAEPSGVDVTITDRGRIDDVERFGFLAFGQGVPGETPVVVAINGADPQPKIRAGIWELGPTAWSPVTRDGSFVSGHDQSQGVVIAPDGRVVHFGDYGYLAVQPSYTAPAEQAVLGFRIKDVLRFARGPDASLWAVTAAGGVARWEGSAAFCEGSLGTPGFLADVASSALGPIVPLPESEALVGLNDGVARVYTDDRDPTLRRNDMETRELFVDGASTEALLVRVDGRAQRLPLDTMNLAITNTPLGVDAAINIDLAATRDQTASSGDTQVLWVVGRVGTARSLLRCAWQAGSEPSCESPIAIPAGPVDLGAEPERFGAVRVLGDDIVVLMASGAVLGRFAAPGSHDTTDLTWVPGTDLRPLFDDPEYFATPGIGADVVEVRPGCALLTGFGGILLALDTVTPSLTAAHALPSDPYQTAVTRLRGDTFLGAGGLGATFYRFTVDDLYCALASEPELLGPARPKLHMVASAVVGDSLWVAEESVLWQLP